MIYWLDKLKPKTKTKNQIFLFITFRLCWWAGELRFSPNWIEFAKPSKNRVSLTIFVQFWRFFTASSILAEFYHSILQEWTLIWLSGFFDTPCIPGSVSIVEWKKFWSSRSLCKKNGLSTIHLAKSFLDFISFVTLVFSIDFITRGHDCELVLQNRTYRMRSTITCS